MSPLRAGCAGRSSRGFVDYTLVARALAHELTGGGGTILTGRRVNGLRRSKFDLAGRRVRYHDPGSRGRHLRGPAVGSSGRHDRRPARAAHGAIPRRVLAAPARRQLAGEGLDLPGSRPGLSVSRVHFTRRTDGQVWAGPNAILALAREGYRRLTIDPREALGLFAWPGFYRSIWCWPKESTTLS